MVLIVKGTGYYVDRSALLDQKKRPNKSINMPDIYMYLSPHRFLHM